MLKNKNNIIKIIAMMSAVLLILVPLTGCIGGLTVNTNSTISNQVIAAIQKINAENLKIQTTSYDLSPLYDYSQENQPPKIYAYKDYTDLNIILDRSGSMASIADDMIGGIKTFLDAEKATGDKTLVSLYQFDDKYDVIFVDKDNKDDININLVPRGNTALLDAIGRTIVSVGEKLTAMEENDRPNRVLFIIITDGRENASKEYTFERVKEQIKYQREVYSWDFLFLGTTEDALFQKEDLGIGAKSALGFDRNSASIVNAFAAVSESYQTYKKLDRNDPATRSLTFEIKQEDE